MLARALLALALGLVCLPSFAHKASDAYLRLQPDHAELSLALKDLDAALPALDGDDDRNLTWGEIKRALPAIVGWVESGFMLRCGSAKAAPPRFVFDSLEHRSDGAYVRLSAPFACPPPAELALDYRLLEGIDASHRLLVAGELDGHPVAFTVAPQTGNALVLRAAAGTEDGATGSANGAAPAAQSGSSVLAHFFPEGVHHILIGLDHLAFLLTLLLPIRLFRARGAAGQAALTTKNEGFGALLRTVTAFTIGHSLTLALASLGFISAPAGWVEPAIAITIGISAALNLYPVPHVRGDALALGFGLIHGLGFSSVMSEAGITGSLLVWGLAGFNLGVEAGQLLVVLGWCALQWALVRLSLYRPALVRAGSWALIALAAYWTLQRVAM
ncbi:MAG: HupE/UreJ family protein [Burkholderiales bacterium]